MHEQDLNNRMFVMFYLQKQVHHFSLGQLIFVSSFVVVTRSYAPACLYVVYFCVNRASSLYMDCQGPLYLSDRKNIFRDKGIFCVEGT